MSFLPLSFRTGLLAALAAALPLLEAACGPGEAPSQAPPQPTASQETQAPADEQDVYTDTKNPQEVFRRGMALYTEGRYEDAAKAFLQATRMRKDFEDAHYFAGRSLLKSFPTDYPGCEREFKKVLELDPNNPQAHLVLGFAYYHWGRFEDAWDQVEAARAVEPDNLEILDMAGQVAEGLGKHEEAVEIMRHAVAVNPKHLPALNQLGLALSHLGKDEEALETYRKALEIQPMNSSALMGAGTCLTRLGRTEEARAMLERFKHSQAGQEAKEMKGKRESVRLRQVEEAYQAGDRNEAHRAAGLLFKEFPRGTDALLSLALVQGKAGDLEAAVETYRKLFEFNPDNLQGHYRLAEVCQRIGDLDCARQEKQRYETLYQKVRRAPRK